jgi:hypothetical protein
MKLFILICNLASVVAFTASPLFQCPVTATTFGRGKYMVQPTWRRSSSSSLNMIEMVDALLPSLIFTSGLVVSISEDQRARDGKPGLFESLVSEVVTSEPAPSPVPAPASPVVVESKPKAEPKPKIEPSLVAAAVEVPPAAAVPKPKSQQRLKQEAEQMKQEAVIAKAAQKEREAKALAGPEGEKKKSRPLILRTLSLLWRILQKIVAPWRKWGAIA